MRTFPTPADLSSIERKPSPADEATCDSARALTRHSTFARALVITTIAALASLLVWSYATDGLVWTLLNSEVSAEEKLAALRGFFAQFGWAAPLAYVIVVTVEVIVAPIPGTMLYAPGGVIFGGFWGGLLSLAGNVLGAGIACQLIRVLSGEKAERFLAKSALAPYEARLCERGAWVVFLLRVNPLTSSDLVSYAAGLTRMPIWKLLLGTLAGMAPLCFVQSYLAEGILTAFPRLVYPLIAACVVYTAVVLWIMSKLLGRSPVATQQ
jgi:uncharacterized membrane protein YdjX (TVP38/TMEM64 family)